MKTFLITGASSGIGAATARLAVDAGYRVVLAARSAGKLAGLVEDLGGAERALAVACDVSDYAAQKAMVDAALDTFGSIDVAFANAGLGASVPGTENGDPENWREMALTNVLGCAYTCKACLPAIKRSSGHVLLTGSRAGRERISGSFYGATKWAVKGYAHNLREELSGSGARVTLIEPGMVNTPFFDSEKPEALQAQDVARAVLYAVSQPAHVQVPELFIMPNSV